MADLLWQQQLLVHAQLWLWVRLWWPLCPSQPLKQQQQPPLDYEAEQGREAGTSWAPSPVDEVE